MATAPTSKDQISHVLIYSGGIGAPQTHSLRGQLAFLNQPGPGQGIAHLPAKKVLIVLSSWGGNTFEARSLYGLLRSLLFDVEIHATGTIKSAAIQVMLAADRRTASPDTTFLFHPWAWGVDANPGHGADGLQQFPLQLEDDVAWGKRILEERTNLTRATIDRMALFEKTSIHDADFALKHGLVEEVADRKIPPGVMTWNVA